MALPFTDAQREAIRRKLFESAQRHARFTGVRKTTLDALTADAGISKSSFYKFYETKEQLFLEVARCWEEDIVSAATDTLAESEGQSDKERAAALVYRAFERTHQLGIIRFLREDLPYLSTFIPQPDARSHFMTSASVIYDALRRARIRFTLPDDVVLSVIQLMYLSILNIGDIGENFFPALHALVQGACSRLVA